MAKLKWVKRKGPRRTLNLKRSDFLDHDTYARAMLRSGSPMFDDIGHLGGGAGLHSQIMSSIWGASLAEFDAMCASDIDQEQRRRPHLFIRKMNTAAQAAAALTQPSLATPSSTAAARGLMELDFNAAYPAAAFAAAFDLIFDTSVTIAWSLMDPEVAANAPTHFTRFLNCLRDWFTSRHLPLAWLYSHANSSRIGLHTHLVAFVPGVISADRLPVATFIRLGEFLPGQRYILASHLDPPAHPVQPPWPRVNYRGEFRTWARNWAEHQMGRPCPRAVRVRGTRTVTTWLHWLMFSYLMKGYESGVVVQSAPYSPDGLAVYLGDLIAWPWRDPGPVPWRRRCGWSLSLGPDRRAVGVPGGLDYLLGKGEFPVPVSVTACRYPPFRSRSEDGCRDVRQLYPAEFYDRITKLPRLPSA